MSDSNSEQYQKLEVITKGKMLVVKVYEICRMLPDSERFGLISQMQRSCISIPSNLAEGQQRGTKEFAHFVNVARGSLAELRVQLELTKDLYPSTYTHVENALIKLDEIGKMSWSLLLKLKAEADVK